MEPNACTDQLLHSKQKQDKAFETLYLGGNCFIVFYKNKMIKNIFKTDTTRIWENLHHTPLFPLQKSSQVSLGNKKIANVCISPCVSVCVHGFYSRPEGAPALCDDPRELCQPPGIHLEPLERVISPRTPGPVIEVIFIKTCLRARSRRMHGAQFYSRCTCWLTHMAHAWYSRLNRNADSVC